MTSHVGLMIVFSCFVSISFATLMRDTPGEQVRFGARLLAGFVCGGLLLGWLLHPFPF
ncbi:MAG: hypothetical protein ABL993_01575 [Vicinamibacterales bacterium]